MIMIVATKIRRDRFSRFIEFLNIIKCLRIPRHDCRQWALARTDVEGSFAVLPTVGAGPKSITFYT